MHNAAEYTWPLTVQVMQCMSNYYKPHDRASLLCPPADHSRPTTATFRYGARVCRL